MSATETVIATYRVRADAEAEFVELLRGHHPTLFAAGLVTADAPVVYRSLDPAPTYFEIFTWTSADAPDAAHKSPAVMAVWEPMMAMVEDRDGRPGMEFPHVRRVELGR